MKKVTENTILSEISSDPRMAEIMAKHNLPCLSCPFAKYEMDQLKIGEVCSQYGIDSKKLIKELNQPASNKGKKPRSTAKR